VSVAAVDASETVVVRALQARDEAAFTDLIRRYSRDLLRVALIHVRSRVVAEEIVREAWLEVLGGIDRFEGRSSLKTWVFGIAIERAQLRATREAPSVPFSTTAGEANADAERFRDGRWRRLPVSFDRLDQQDAIRCVEKTIATLSLQQRTVITLRDICGLSAAEVCGVLCVTQENQRVLLHRARARVCAALEQLQLSDRPVPPPCTAPSTGAPSSGHDPVLAG
jgi:RNA polymerase sigma-70 factor, ECF subfamily